MPRVRAEGSGDTATEVRKAKVNPNPGSIVRCRNRDWVLLPSADPQLHRLRPLTGVADDVVAVHKELGSFVKETLPEETVRPATFPLPRVEDIADVARADLLWQASRLTLREGAAPFRSLGRISVRPRLYQFVPLLMALRLDAVRLLIADDVGVGKTIEALLVARELFDRGEIGSMSVVCPPNLCDQWRREMEEKFGLGAVVIRSGTLGRLERHKPATESVWRHYPIHVTSIDFVKTDRNRHAFLQDLPDLVIVDEAHGAAKRHEGGQQQRHELVRQISARDAQHLILLTATPHSGIEQAFRSLIALLQPAFAEWDTSSLNEGRRKQLARHYVQRTRRDIEKDWEGESVFPRRIPSDETYALSGAYARLFDRAYRFCREIVATGADLDERRRRVQYWGALQLLRCVMSSPAAAEATLMARKGAATVNGHMGEPLLDEVAASAPYPDDEEPVGSVGAAIAHMDPGGQRLGNLVRAARKLRDSPEDHKLIRCGEIISQLIRNGYHPIVWCRFVATAEYVACGLTRILRPRHKDVRLLSITGRIGHEERRTMVRELEDHPCRVLVATDCLSEGVNLQNGFSAVLHYDLPWNPNRLEQREGRVDRYGQRKPGVRAIRYYCRTSPIDGALLRVLLDKARKIHKVLGTYVPVPQENRTVTEALLAELFLKGGSAAGQLALDLVESEKKVKDLHRRWDRDVEREKTNRTRFAQRAIKPERVRLELEATDDVLGDPKAVRRFVLAAGQRLGLGIRRDKKRPDIYCMPVGPPSRANMPDPIRICVPSGRSEWPMSFASPTPEGAEYVGRNHPFVGSLARYILEEAIEKKGDATATRCGVVRTRAVRRMRTLFLLRARYLLKQPDRTPLLSEEVRIQGVKGLPDGRSPRWLQEAEARELLVSARPDANVPLAEKKELVRLALDSWDALQSGLEAAMKDRARTLLASHKRVRKSVGMKVRGMFFEPQPPPDLIGILILQPVV